MKITFKQFAVYPHPATKDRKSGANFRLGYLNVCQALVTEIERIGGTNIVLKANIAPKFIKSNGWPSAEARPDHPGVVVLFDCKRNATTQNPTGRTGFACDEYVTWWHNLRGITLGMEALRAVDRHNIRPAFKSQSTGAQYQGFSGLPAVVTQPAQANQGGATDLTGSLQNVLQQQLDKWETAAKLLLRESGAVEITPAKVKAMCSESDTDRTWAKTIARKAAGNAHPDNGGTSARSVAVQNARKELKL